MEWLLLSFLKRHNKQVCNSVRNGHSSNMWVEPVFNGWDMVGTLISKFEGKSWDIDIKNITVSHCDHTKCILVDTLTYEAKDCC